MKSNAFLFLLCTLSYCSNLFASSTVTRQPSPLTNSVSLGATVENRISGQSTIAGTISYQWTLNGGTISGATNSTLAITNVQSQDAGAYVGFISDPESIASSKPWVLSVDPAFTKISNSPIVAANGANGVAWGDFNNDGFLDLFLPSGGPTNLLFLNNRNGTFFRITTNGLGGDKGSSVGAVWGDYDNDGFLDLFGANGTGGKQNLFYHNNGNGTFMRLTNNVAVASAGSALGTAWADYDNDGFIDLFVANDGQKNLLFHNNGDGTFQSITNTAITLAPVQASQGAAWGDYDNDGYPDLFVCNWHNQKNLLFHNNGNGMFTRVLNDPIVNDVANFSGCSWGDYDNDGFLDLFVSTFGPRNFLYHNNGDRTFTKITTGPIPTDVSHSYNGCWADYDADGYLDLFVVNGFGPPNFLYHNNGDGTFKRITSGSLVNDVRDGLGAAWADYDNDGFPDLAVANRSAGQNNVNLYHNNGNSNNWLTVRCAGRISNRSAIGTKVRVKATIRGREIWQLREISSGGGCVAPGGNLDAQFGLGDALVGEIVRVEWPSGIVQEFKNVVTKQILNIREPAKLT
jgi:hypothetical protein